MLWLLFINIVWYVYAYKYIGCDTYIATMDTRACSSGLSKITIIEVEKRKPVNRGQEKEKVREREEEEERREREGRKRRKRE